jgi:tetratricopeptide (TPR) repeat protein
LNYLGYMLADRNERLNEALEMIQKAVDMDPHNAAFLDSLGWVYYRLNRLEEAEDYLRRSLERGSRDATVHDHLGDVLVSRGNLKDAIAQWEIAVREWQSAAPSEMDPKAVAKIEQKLENAKVRLARESGQARRRSSGRSRAIPTIPGDRLHRAGESGRGFPVPPGFRLSISPPCSRRMRRKLNMLQLPEAMRPPAVWKRGSKMVARSSRFIPLPSSTTRISTASSVEREETRMRPDRHQRVGGIQSTGRGRRR